MSAEHEQSFAKLQALRNEKSTLKAKLRAYDNAFQQEHGRLVSDNNNNHNNHNAISPVLLLCVFIDRFLMLSLSCSVLVSFAAQ